MPVGKAEKAQFAASQGRSGRPSKNQLHQRVWPGLEDQLGDAGRERELAAPFEGQFFHWLARPRRQCPVTSHAVGKHQLGTPG